MAESDEKPAPGALELVRDFLNTSPRDAGEDRLAEPGGLRSWLAERDLMTVSRPLDLEQVERVLGFRQALLSIVPTGKASAISHDAVTALNHLAGRSPMVIRVDDAGVAQLEPASAGVDAAVARLMAITYIAMVQSTWPRLRRCANRQCRRVFYDRSKNASGRWCSMTGCGNVANARAYRKRKKATS